MAMAMGAPNINDFIQREADLKAEATTIFDKATAEKRGLDEQESARIDAIKGEMAANSAAKEREEFRLKLERDGAGKIQVGVDNNSLKPWASFGEQLKAIVQAGTPGGSIDPRLIRPQAAITGASESVDSSGGFLVDKAFAPGLMQRTYETAQLLSRCSTDPIGSGFNGMKYRMIDETSRVTGSRSGGVRMYWLDEGAEKTASGPKFRIMSLELKKLAGMFYSTDELLADAPALESVVNREFPKEASFVIDDAILRGDGAGKPLGIFNSPSLIVVSKEGGQLANTVLAQNIIKMRARLFATSRANSVWFINQDVEPALHTMSIAVGTGGIPVYMPANGLSVTPYSTLFGRPVIPIEQAETLGTQGDIILADLSEYQVITKGGIQTDTSIHVRFAFDETAFRWVVRIDGQPKWNAPLTPYKGTATVSPFVVLQTRA